MEPVCFFLEFRRRSCEFIKRVKHSTFLTYECCYSLKINISLIFVDQQEISYLLFFIGRKKIDFYSVQYIHTHACVCRIFIHNLLVKKQLLIVVKIIIF